MEVIIMYGKTILKKNNFTYPDYPVRFFLFGQQLHFKRYSQVATQKNFKKHETTTHCAAIKINCIIN